MVSREETSNLSPARQEIPATRLVAARILIDEYFRFNTRDTVYIFPDYNSG
jgi:hypothetical protein